MPTNKRKKCSKGLKEEAALFVDDFLMSFIYTIFTMTTIFKSLDDWAIV